MDAPAKVSIIIPCYNYGHFIGETLESVLSQTYPHWECWVVDDGSTDNTAQVVAHYSKRDSRIRCVHQDNQGLSAARNTGIRRASGAYLQFLDSDDLLESMKLEKHVEYLEAHPDVDFVYTNTLFFRDQDPAWGRRISHDGSPPLPALSGRGFAVVSQLVQQNCIIGPHAPLMRRSVVDAVGFFDPDADTCADWDYWLRCALAGTSFQSIDVEGARPLYRWHEGSMSKDSFRVAFYHRYVHQKLASAISNPDILALNRKRILGWEQAYAVEIACRGNIAESMLHYLRIVANPSHPKIAARCLICALALPFLRRDQMRRFLSESWTKSLFGSASAVKGG